MRNAITDLQNLDVSGMPIPSMEQQVPASLSMDLTYPMNFSNSHSQIPTGMNGYNTFEPNGGVSYLAHQIYSLAGQNHCPDTRFPYVYDTHSAIDPQEPDWTQFTSGFTSFPQPETLDFLPIQHPLEPPQNIDVKVTPLIPKKQSKELVGMGLYDHPDRDSPSSLDYSALSPGYLVNSHRESVGKGLKLEETWQPPQNPEEEEAEDDAEEEEEEAYSTDEADEDLPPVVSPTPVAETQKSFYPTYGDLSNQTFFLDDDSYTSCLAFDQQAIQLCQKPNVPDAAYGGNNNYNIVWI